MARKLVPKNKLYVGDNLDVMRGMNGCTVDLIYLDRPPHSAHFGFFGSCMRCHSMARASNNHTTPCS